MCVHGSVCHSGIKFMNAVRRSQTEELLEARCEEEGGAERVWCLSCPLAHSARSWHGVLTQSRGQTSSRLPCQRERGEGIQG